MNRRQFLAGSGAFLSLYQLPLHAAEVQSQSRLVWVLLRGALDGLSALVPYADPHYRALRGGLSIPAPGGSGTSLKLDGNFALHPALENMHQLYQRGNLIAYPAVASPYRERSHFDGQNLLENGGVRPFGHADGWINRALQQVAMRTGPVRGLAVGSAVPLSMQGSASVEAWSPSVLPTPDEDLYVRLAQLYDTDDLLSARLQSLQRTRDDVMDMAASDAAGPQQAFRQMAETAGRLMSAVDGPRVASLELGGWDTHANQGSVNGRLANQLRILDQGLLALQQGLGEAWQHTRVVVMTEFGRTARANGSNGTDHGTASAAFVLGGAVQSGRVAGDWPGLAEADLYQGRDLRPTMDTRQILADQLSASFNLSADEITGAIFPGAA